MQRYRVLVVDDHPLARKAVRTLLEDEPAFEIVGEAASGEEAVERMPVLKPDVVLMDLNLPRMGGLEATRRIKRLMPEVKVIVLSVSDSVQDLFSAVQAGAQGYLPKNIDPAEWASMLLALVEDGAKIPGSMADRLFASFRTGHSHSPSMSEEGEAYRLLTSREKEILGLVAAGKTNRQIALQLSISENTVKNHLKNLLDKLGLANRVQLTGYAIKHRLIPFDPDAISE